MISAMIGAAIAPASGGALMIKDSAMPRAASNRSTMTRQNTIEVVRIPNTC
jgi:hypothetical protein